MDNKDPKLREGDKREAEDVSASPRHPISASSSQPAHHFRHPPRLYGVMAEFEGPNELVHAARRTYEEGYRRINGYSPYPIEELSEAIGFTRSALPLIVFIGGVIGGLGGFYMQY